MGVKKRARLYAEALRCAGTRPYTTRQLLSCFDESNREREEESLINSDKLDRFSLFLRFSNLTDDRGLFILVV